MLPLAVLTAALDEVEKTDAVLAKLARIALEELSSSPRLTANGQRPPCACQSLDTRDFSPALPLDNDFEPVPGFENLDPASSSNPPGLAGPIGAHLDGRQEDADRHAGGQEPPADHPSADHSEPPAPEVPA